MLKLIFFDLDDTLTYSRYIADEEMVSLLVKLLEKFRISIISWSSFEAIYNQVVIFLENKWANLKNLYIQHAQWGSLYIYKNVSINCKIKNNLKYNI